MKFTVLGISAYYHDSACCIISDGKLLAAAQEERFSRNKHDPSLPARAFSYCLEESRLSITDVDCIAYYEDPIKKLSRQLWSLPNSPKQTAALNTLDPGRPEREIREILGYEGEILFGDHHRSHAASSYLFSGFKEAAILTMDGVGEWATTTYGKGEGTTVSLIEEVSFPHSLGLLYSTITSYLGFGVNDGEYKVMGLAPYGKPTYIEQIRTLLSNLDKGQYTLSLEFFEFLGGTRMFSEKLIDLFNHPVRKKGEKITEFTCDVARSLQFVLEEVVLSKVNYLHDSTGSDNLCMAGGVALNCVLNGVIQKRGPFKNVFVQPASNDTGCALGAAALAYVSKTGKPLAGMPLTAVDLGPQYDSDSIGRVLGATSIRYQDHRNDEDELLREVSQRLAEKKVIGWFQGRMEFGPRALGHRSILADPRDPGMKDKINSMVKKREGFRPFAPAVLEEKMDEHFDLGVRSPFMLFTCQTISSFDLPAITHVDGSARVQSVGRTNHRFHSLLKSFYSLTGCPILLNTSFNVKDEPIVCSPTDALLCFINTDIDCLVLGDFIIDKKSNNLSLLQFLDNQETGRKLIDNVYTFM